MLSSKPTLHSTGSARTGAADVLVCHENGAADVLVCQGPQGLPTPEPKDKLLRSFANGDVCGSPLNPPPPIRVIRGQSLLDPAPTPKEASHA